MRSIRDQILSSMEALRDLPTLQSVPRMVCEKLQAREREGQAYPVQDIAGMIGRDADLAAKVLRMANSVYYNKHGGAIGDISTAIDRIGSDELCRICLTLSIMRLFPPALQLIPIKEFWRHSIAVALACRKIAGLSKVVSGAPARFYATGLLHDLGILVLDRFFPTEYRKVRENGEKDIFEREREFLGIDHGEIGSLLAERWKLSASLVTAIRWHHEPDGASGPHLSTTQVLHLADFSCSVLGFLEPGNPMPKICSLGAWSDLQVNPDNVQLMVHEIEMEIERSNTFIEIGL